jgi:hypothetical protein
MSQEEPNRNVRGPNSEEELPPELKAMEAELSALRPRDDRLDRERLVFLAGRASTAGRPAMGRWAWPAAFAGMTAVAAGLLVALVLRPEPEVVERIRIVTVPAEAQVDEPSSLTEEVGDEADSPAAPQRRTLQPRPAARDWASRRTGAPPRPDWERFGSRAEYVDALGRMLARGVDPWRQPLTVSGRGDRDSDAPVLYRRALEKMLDDRARGEQPGARLMDTIQSGANS